MAEDNNLISEKFSFSDETHLLQKALAELAEAIKPLSNSPDIMDYVNYLYLIWAGFQVYPLSTDEEGDGSGGAKIIPLDNGRKIFDYGYCLSTSTGEDYGSYSQGKTIVAAQEMIAILAARGVKQVGFAGSLIAKRAAWIECVERNIEVTNYDPSMEDWQAHQRVTQLRAQAKKIRRDSEPRPQNVSN